MLIHIDILTKISNIPRRLYENATIKPPDFLSHLKGFIVVDG